MTISVTKDEGVTVLTLTSDSQSFCPPLWQILKALCYNPVCCSVSQHLRRTQGLSQTILGIHQILLGELNIGLGIILRVCDAYLYPLHDTLFPVWLGILFIVFGIVCILSQKYPSPCLVIINVLLNLAAIAFAITGIVLYSITVGNIYFWQNCNPSSSNNSTPSPSGRTVQTCLWFQGMALLLVRGICGVLIVLSAVQLCVAISAFVLGIKALKKSEPKGTEAPEHSTPLLEDAATNC